MPKTFINSFVVPDNINPYNYIEGTKYFIKGCKGTGKTALLRYISIIAEEKFDAKSYFVLFKSDFDQDERKKFSRASNANLVEKNSFDSDIDFEIVWRWFLHRIIVENVNNNVGIFIRDENWERYEKCISSIKLNDEKSGIKRLIPKIIKNNVEIEGNMDFLKGKLGVLANLKCPKADGIA